MGGLDRTKLVIGRDPARAEIVSVLVKRSYRLEPVKGITEQIEAEPWISTPVVWPVEGRLGCELVHDFEWFPWKSCTDVIVRGEIVAPGGRPVRSLLARVVVGHASKDAHVVGDRWIERGWFTEPQPFATMPIEWSRAYGGVDTAALQPRKPGPFEDPAYEHPAAYPRNPIGAGWVLGASLLAREGVPLPNFEDPRRRLTPETILIDDPSRWSWAPEPRSFGWVHRSWYPRCAFLGLLPVFAPADGESKLPEVTSGWMPRWLSRWLRELGSGMPVHPRHSNGASAGLRVPDLIGGEPVLLDGFYLRGPVSFELPKHRPRITVQIGSERLATEVVAHTLEIEPGEQRVTLIWAGRARTGSQLRIRMAGLEATERELFEDMVAEVDGRVVEHSDDATP